jgi:dTMP kinase
MRGLFITFEGIEGSGKTTLIEPVAEALRKRGHDPLLTREPGGTDLGLALRKVLLNPRTTGMDSLTELMLFGADRAQHVAEVIRPALEAGRVILCDRFSDATCAYQGFGRGIPLETVNAVDEVAKAGIHPDMTALLDIPAELGLVRVSARNSKAADISESRIDEEELVFHRKVREGYLLLAQREPDRFFVLDARLSPPELAEAVMKELAMRFEDVI